MPSVLENVTLKTSITEEMSNKQCLNTPENISLYSKSNPGCPGSGTSYEVFRNNTTAIEVIVKDIPLRRRRTKTTLNNYNHTDDSKIQKLEEENENLKIDLNKANTKLALARNGFTGLVTELQNQLVKVSRREMEQQYINIKLKMENEKLKTHLESKSRVVTKLRKELTGMQRLLKYVVKVLKISPRLRDSYSVNSVDTEYDEFEKGLKHETRVSFSPSSFDATGASVSLDEKSKNMNTL
ncbi:hypothetical protein NE865_15783 [Phthorimaea operculella]|nr:hypothetical protein NE865_15783 [Phthorimaea operculella]